MNKRKDEKALISVLFEDMKREGSRSIPPSQIHTVFNCLQINHKRGEYILNKWADKGQWEYGATVVGGWFTDEGLRDFGFDDD